MQAPFDNSYARLPQRFFARLRPTPVSAPRLIKLNRALADELGLDAGSLAAPEGIAMLAGNQVSDELACDDHPLALSHDRVVAALER